MQNHLVVTGLEAAWDTHIGYVRRHNEDAVSVLPLSGGGLFVVVADGMGGHQAGEVASAIAIESLGRSAEKWPDGADDAAQVASLRDGLRNAARAINRAGDADVQRASMGAAAVVAAVTPEAVLHQHAGDCRMYCFRDGERRYRTRDHSLVDMLCQLGELTEEEVFRHPLRNQLYSCLGGGQSLTSMEISPPWADDGPPEAVQALAPGDLLLFSSDGLHGVLGEQPLLDAVRERWGRSPDNLVAELIDLALGAGGDDNITVVAVRVGG